MGPACQDWWHRRALPALLAPAAQARQIASDSLRFFCEAIFEHHRDEERNLFPTVCGP
jgi:hypothetical protein